MIALLAVLWARRGGTSWTYVLLLLVAAGWILLITRTVSLGVVVLAPLLAQALHEVLPGRDERALTPRVERRFLVVAAAAYLIVLGLVVPQTADVPGGVPTRLQPRLAALPSGSAVLVDDGIGGWMEWAVPDVHPVIDGMLDAYPVSYIQDFEDFQDVKPGWQDFVRSSGADAAVVLEDSPAAAALQDQLGWKPVQRDRDWVYLVPASSR
jgi:hypothetical protein